jgi:hypothetical protein
MHLAEVFNFATGWVVNGVGAGSIVSMWSANCNIARCSVNGSRTQHFLTDVCDYKCCTPHADALTSYLVALEINPGSKLLKKVAKLQQALELLMLEEEDDDEAADGEVGGNDGSDGDEGGADYEDGEESEAEATIDADPPRTSTPTLTLAGDGVLPNAPIMTVEECEVSPHPQLLLPSQGRLVSTTPISLRMPPNQWEGTDRQSDPMTCTRSCVEENGCSFSLLSVKH